jgi:hypothetical protein
LVHKVHHRISGANLIQPVPSHNSFTTHFSINLAAPQILSSYCRSSLYYVFNVSCKTPKETTCAKSKVSQRYRRWHTFTLLDLNGLLNICVPTRLVKINYCVYETLPSAQKFNPCPHNIPFILTSHLHLVLLLQNFRAQLCMQFSPLQRMLHSPV